VIDENVDDLTGVYAISFVDFPANEVDFIALADQKELRLNKDEKKQVLTGVVLKPEQLIYRNSAETGDYYIKFSAAQIAKIAQKMMKTGIALRNTTHQHQSPLDGNYLTELWIVENPLNDKANALGFTDLPKGTLMCSYKIEDKNYWANEVMTGNVKGFSLEGFFNQEISLSKINYNKMNDKKKKTKQTLLGRIANMLLDIEAVEKSDAANGGEAYVIFVLADGKEAYVDKDGFATLDNEQMPAGEHKLANGSSLVIDEQGQFVETKEASADKLNPEDARAKQALKRDKAKHNLAELDPKTAEALKAKVTEMQSTIDQLTKALNDARSILENTKSQVEEMRKKTPSAYPATHLTGTPKNFNEMTTAERMAVALNQTINRRSL
jgi:hypothetical protein